VQNVGFKKLAALAATVAIVAVAIAVVAANFGVFSNPQVFNTTNGSLPSPSASSSAGGSSIGNGAILYATYCESCHGSLSATSKAGRTSVQIQNALNNVPAMKSLSGLTASQIRDIAYSLGSSK
jgi:hypothetical protein